MAVTNHERLIYSPQALVKGFAEVSSDIVDTPTSMLLVKWYRSPFVDLQIWLDKKSDMVIRQQFSFLGLVVEWNHIQGVKTGIVEDVKSKMNSKSWSVKVIYDDILMKHSLNQAIEVLECCQELPEKVSILQNFNNNPKLSRFQSFKLIFRHLFSKKKKN